MHFPKLIVFDFHGVLSLKEGSSRKELIGDFDDTFYANEIDRKNIKINNLKTALKKIKPPKTTMDWYKLMKTSNIDPYIMMPTLDEVIEFIEIISKSSKDTIFAIASMGDYEPFMLDMLKYCFESQNRVSPFTKDTVVGQMTLNKYGTRLESGKLKHMAVLIKNLDSLGIKIEHKDIVLIDDKLDVLRAIYPFVCGVLVEEYFKISEWNNGCVDFKK